MIPAAGIIIVLGIGMAALVQQGDPVGQPEMVFGQVGAIKYYPRNSMTGYRDTTEIRYADGPTRPLWPSILLCGDHASELTPGTYFRGMARLWELEVPEDNSSARCWRVTQLEQWSSSARHPETVSGTLQPIVENKDPRAVPLDLKLTDGTSKQMMACEDGKVLGLMRSVVGRSIVLAYDTGLHSKQVGCDPIFGVGLSVVSTSATTPQIDNHASSLCSQTANADFAEAAFLKSVEKQVIENAGDDNDHVRACVAADSRSVLQLDADSWCQACKANVGLIPKADEHGFTKLRLCSRESPAAGCEPDMDIHARIAGSFARD
jgi:hypothetical protein